MCAASPEIGSLLLATRDPARLRDWYERAFGVAALQALPPATGHHQSELAKLIISEQEAS
jgi:hypothetical protein